MFLKSLSFGALFLITSCSSNQEIDSVFSSAETNSEILVQSDIHSKNSEIKYLYLKDKSHRISKKFKTNLIQDPDELNQGYNQDDPISAEAARKAEIPEKFDVYLPDIYFKALRGEFQQLDLLSKVDDCQKLLKLFDLTSNIKAGSKCKFMIELDWSKIDDSLSNVHGQSIDYTKMKPDEFIFHTHKLKIIKS